MVGLVWVMVQEIAEIVLVVSWVVVLVVLAELDSVGFQVVVVGEGVVAA